MGKVLTEEAIWAANMVYCGDALVRYFENNIPPGSAFQAILENDLMGVMQKGDSTTLRELHNICKWLYRYAPCGLYGSEEYVYRHLNSPQGDFYPGVANENL